MQLCSQHNCLFSCETLLSDWRFVPFCDPAVTYFHLMLLPLSWFLFLPVNLADGNAGAVSPPSSPYSPSGPIRRPYSHITRWSEPPPHLPKVPLTVYPWMKFFPGRRDDAMRSLSSIRTVSGVSLGELWKLCFIRFILFSTHTSRRDPWVLTDGQFWGRGGYRRGWGGRVGVVLEGECW